MATEIFFTSDTHFNHQYMLNTRKQFTSLEEMNEQLIANWNSRVKRNDLVYHLGDFALGSVAEAVTISNRLNGQIYLVRGNHDRVAENKLCRNRFVWIKDLHRVKIDGQKIYLLHYAMRTWNCMHHGSWHLHGHSHGSLPELDVKSFDVGVDCWNLFPVSYEEVATKMATKTFIPVDHHTGDE